LKSGSPQDRPATQSAQEAAADILIPARAILDGHLGTGMFPDTTMTDQELIDTLAYLALLRSEGSAKRK